MVATAFGLATVAAAYEAGLLSVDGPQVLLTLTNTPDPVSTTPLTEVGGVTALIDRFDAVHDLNAALAPRHPRRWLPLDADLPAEERRLRLLWGLGDDDVTLLSESVAGEPAHALARVFGDAPLEVYSDGLMSYGATGGLVDAGIGRRVTRVLHLDLVPGLVPVLHREWGARCTVIPSEALRAVIDPGPEQVPTRRPSTALVLGQYLATDGLVGREEEIELYAELVRRCLDLGLDRIVFKQHPSAPADQGRAVAAVAGEPTGPGARFVVARQAELVETWFARGEADLVVGCFSTALLTAATCYGLPVARLGTGLLLDRMTPVGNLNRVPVLLVDATVPALDREPPGPVRVPSDLQELVEAVGDVMQPGLRPAHHARATAYLDAHPAERVRYLGEAGQRVA